MIYISIFCLTISSTKLQTLKLMIYKISNQLFAISLRELYFCYILMVFLSIYGISYTIGKLEISSFKCDTNLSMNSVHSPFIHYLLYNICTQISRLLSIQLPLYKSMRCTRESLLSTYHSHTLPWMNLIAILWYYNENHVGALKLALIINFVGSAHNQWRIGIIVLPGFSLLLRSKSPLSSFLVRSAWHL